MTIAAAAGSFLALTEASGETSRNDMNADLSPSITRLYETLIGAWNARDAQAFARCFTADGSTVGFDGTQLDGAKAIESSLTSIFQNHPTARYVTIVREIRNLGETVALLRAVAGMVPPGTSTVKAEVNAVQSLIAVKRDREWRVALFQNTPAAFHGRPEPVRSLTEELQEAFATQAFPAHEIAENKTQ